jgi:hypothetical protein
MLRLMMCERHSTCTPYEVGPGPGEHRAAPPVELLCPLCIAARNDYEPEYTGTRTHFETTRGALNPDSLPPRLREVYIAKLVEQKKAGRVVAGSVEETDALAQMDVARDESVWYDHASPAERRRRSRRQHRGYSPPAFREMA